MSRSVLPQRRLLDIDDRLEHEAAKPVIVPEMIVCDHGKAFISRNFRASCRFLEIDFQPTHKAAPFQKGHVEKMLDGVGTLFAQFVAGYTGRSTGHRGRNLTTTPTTSPGSAYAITTATASGSRLLGSTCVTPRSPSAS